MFSSHPQTGHDSGTVFPPVPESSIINTANKSGAKVVGPVPLPTDREVVTVIRSPHKHKDSREQFESRTHKRMIDVYPTSPKQTDAFMKLDLPAGVEIKIEL